MYRSTVCLVQVHVYQCANTCTVSWGVYGGLASQGSTKRNHWKLIALLCDVLTYDDWPEQGLEVDGFSTTVWGSSTRYIRQPITTTTAMFCQLIKNTSTSPDN